MAVVLEAVAVKPKSTLGIKVADAVWIATAFLHSSRPAQQAAFTIDEIVRKVMSLNLTEGSEKSIRQHVLQHCEALSRPQPNRSRMLYATRPTHRRLFRSGDRYHPGREGSPTHPDWNQLPSEYRHLRQWYETVWNKAPNPTEVSDPLLELAGTGPGMWGEGSADDYVNSLRSGWEASR